MMIMLIFLTKKKILLYIEFKNQSMNSSLKSLSHGEEFLQNDVLQVLNNPQKVSLFKFF